MNFHFQRTVLISWKTETRLCLTVPGLIHIGQTIKQHEDLQQLLDAPCCLESRITDYRLVPRGVEVDISMRVIAASERCVWSGVATLLSRSPQTQSSGGAPSISRQQVDSSLWDSQGRYQWRFYVHFCNSWGQKLVLLSKLKCLHFHLQCWFSLNQILLLYCLW